MEKKTTKSNGRRSGRSPLSRLGIFPTIRLRSKTMSKCKSHAIAICDDRYHGCNDFSRGSVDIHPDNDLNERFEQVKDISN